MAMRIRSGAAAVLSLLISVGLPTIAQAASAGDICKKAGRTSVSSGVNLRCTQTKSGLKWRKFTPPVVASQPVVDAPPVVVTPSVSVEPTLLRQSGVISVNSNVVGTVYIAEVSVKVAKVSDIENAGSYLWVSAPITKVGVNEISVDIDAIINGNYRVYVANSKGVLSAASLNMVVVSMPRIYDRVAAQSWSRQFGTNRQDYVWSIAVDAAGNVYTAGETLGDLYGDNPSTASDIFVNKFDFSGNLIASVQFGSYPYDGEPKIFVDSSGNVFVAGFTEASISGNTHLGGRDGFVAKFNSSLVLQGTVKQFGTTGNDEVSDVAVNAFGDVFVVGVTTGDFSGNANLGGYDGFVAKFNSSLVLQGTVKQFGTTGNDFVEAVETDDSGSVFVGGGTEGAFSGNTNLGGYDGFVAKFNSSLVLQGTVNQFGTTGEDQVWCVVVDGSGSVFVAGFTEGVFSGNTNLGSNDGFVAKFNSSLVLQGTVKQFGTTEDDLARSIAVDSASNVYIAGSTEGAFSGNTHLGSNDGFVAKFNSSLVLQGTVKQFGTTEDDLAYSIAVDSTSSVHVGGYTEGDLFGSQAGEGEAFVYKEVA
jgi:hypothetical protein